jgi:hypothetical protein
MNKIKINRVKLYEKYIAWADQVADDIPEKTHFEIDEIINAISRILESDTDIIQQLKQVNDTTTRSDDPNI